MRASRDKDRALVAPLSAPRSILNRRISRNRRFGELLAGGRTVDQGRTEIGEAIEGIATSGVALELARSGSVAYSTVKAFN